jgi:hypothetical protein
MTTAKEKFEQQVDGNEGIDPVELNDLRSAKESKSEEIRELANGSTWWIPDNEDFFEKGKKRNSLVLKSDYDHKDEEVEQKTIKGMVPLGCVLNENNDFKGDQYLLKFVDIDTGEVMYTPITGGIRAGLVRETPLTKDLLNRETDFDKETQKQSAVIVKYWGKIYNEEEDNSFHSYTVKSLK